MMTTVGRRDEAFVTEVRWRAAVHAQHRADLPACAVQKISFLGISESASGIGV
jgi:hypothetical protein